MEAGWVLQGCLVKALIVMEKGGGVLQFNAEKGGWLAVVQGKIHGRYVNKECLDAEK